MPAGAAFFEDIAGFVAGMDTRIAAVAVVVADDDFAFEPVDTDVAVEFVVGAD